MLKILRFFFPRKRQLALLLLNTGQTSVNLYYRHEFLAAICGGALSMSKGKEMSGTHLAASQCPQWSPQGCLMSSCSSNGRGKIA